MSMYHLNRRSFLTSTAAILASTVVGGGVAAAGQISIDRINFLVPFSPGSGSFDLTCHAAATALNTTKLVKSATVQNIDGGGGARAYEHLADHSADSRNTIMLVGTSMMARSGKGAFPYKIGDLTAVARFSIEPLTFAVKADSRFKSLKDVVAALRADPASIRFSSDSDPGLSEHLCAAKMLAKAGIAPKSVTYVPRTGHGRHIEAMLAGEVDVVVAAAADILEHYKDKSARVLAVSAEKRAAQLPDAPTLAEVGLPDAFFYNARGFFMAPSTDAARANAMGDVLEKMVATPEWEKAAKEAEVTMLFARLPEAKTFFEDQERDVHVLQTALGVAK